MIGYAAITPAGEKICIGYGNMPNRKKPCLIVMTENCETKYASFNDEYSAREFIDIFADFIGAPKIDWAEVE